MGNKEMTYLECLETHNEEMRKQVQYHALIVEAYRSRVRRLERERAVFIVVLGVALVNEILHLIL
jgi:hypothetical protein